MIVEKQFLLKLKELGLNSYEAKLWVAILSRGSSTAGELSDISNVPRSRTYDVLESLKTKGFIEVKDSKPIRYVAVSPEKVIENLKKHVAAKTQGQLDLMNLVREENVLDELNSLHSQGADLIEPHELSGALKGRENIYNQCESMIRAAEKTIDIHTTNDGVLRKLTQFAASLTDASKRGVKVRILANLDNIPKKEISQLKAFSEVKHTSTPARFCLVDNKSTVIMLGDNDTHPAYDIGLWLSAPSFSMTLKQIFEKEFSE